VARRPGPRERAVGLFLLLFPALSLAFLLHQRARHLAGENAPASSDELREPRGEPALLLPTQAEAFRPMGPGERFGPENLYEKIDGRADLYLQARFVSLSCQRYADPEDPSRWLELLVYELGSSDDAFTVASTQRRPGLDAYPIGDGAEGAGGTLFLRTGPFYAEILASEASHATHRASLALARELVAALAPGVPRGTLAEAVPPPPEEALFPEEGRLAGRLVRIPRDAFGFEPFDGMLTQDYLREDRALVAFVLVCADPAEARAKAAAYAEFLASLGALSVPVEAPPDASRFDGMGATTVFFVRGSFVGGVQEAPEASSALALARDLALHLERRLP
jgi:hypothetical protein